ncbi:MAG: polysaccharide deacetylase family protein [Candidatus Micrarchaeota archaeon]
MTGNKKIVFTVDVDRDLAWHKQGTHEAVTKDKDTAVFDATREGLKRLLEVLKDENIPATFFFEAAAAQEINAREKNNLSRLVSLEHEIAGHGFHHEDFTGSLTGVIMTKAKKKAVLEKSRKALKKIFPKRRITGFRAPYLNYDDELFSLLGETGYAYDSSAYSKLPRVEKKGRIFEIPLTEGVDARGKRMVSYLWPLMEGNRSVVEYDEFASRVLSQSDFLVVATHSWHTHLSIEGRRPDSEIEQKVQDVGRILRALGEQGEFVTMQRLLSK